MSFFIQAVIQISNNLMGSKLDQDPSSLFSQSSIHLCNSNSNWTFIALNLPKQEDSKVQQNKKADIKISVSNGIAGVKHHRECQENDAS